MVVVYGLRARRLLVNEREIIGTWNLRGAEIEALVAFIRILRLRL